MRADSLFIWFQRKCGQLSAHIFWHTAPLHSMIQALTGMLSPSQDLVFTHFSINKLKCGREYVSVWTVCGLCVCVCVSACAFLPL